MDDEQWNTYEMQVNLDRLSRGESTGYANIDALWASRGQKAQGVSDGDRH